MPQQVHRTVGGLPTLVARPWSSWILMLCLLERRSKGAMPQQAHSALSGQVLVEQLLD